MKHLRLRTQLLAATLLLLSTFTGASLLIIRYLVRSEIDRQVREGIGVSVEAFKNVERQREIELSHAAAMLAELPTLKALMTTDHEPTIQDGSEPFWKLAGSDLLILARHDTHLLAMHVAAPGWSRESAELHLKKTLESSGNSTAWWYDDGRLYWIVVRPLVAGGGSEQKELGLIVAGYQLDSRVAEQLARVTGGEIALTSGGRVIASTLSPAGASELAAQIAGRSLGWAAEAREISLAQSRYEIASVLLQSGFPTPVQCYVLMPLERAASFMRRLNRTILVLGIAAIGIAAIFCTLISRAITRPLDNLVAGVRALAAGDYEYSITPKGSSEVAELGRAFATMRTRLHQSQQKLIEAERIAALGRTAGSISHDLRHYLAAVVANAEFLYEAEALRLDRDEVYQEIQTASAQMTDLIDSLRELSHEHITIVPAPSNLELTARHAVDTVNARHEFRSVNISIETGGEMVGVFDAKKIERVLFNLVLNACEAISDRPGHVRVEIESSAETFEVRVADNGPGIASSVRDTMFDPFVSSGKLNGTGLGLAIVSKIVHDHNGVVRVERTSDAGTVIVVRFPRFYQPVEAPSQSVKTPLQS